MTTSIGLLKHGTTLAILIIFNAFALIMTSVSQISLADNINTTVYSVDSKPYGMAYTTWIDKWWQWLVSIPQSSNPANDATGKNCGLGQNGRVWFLAGTNGGSAERTCVIPAGKAILFPVINSECDFISMPNIKTDTGLVACATATDTVSNMQTTVDGLNLQQLEKYRVTSQPFTVTFASNNVFGYKPGTTSMASDGFWVFLQPLVIGKHEVHFSGLSAGNPTTGTQNFATDATYHIIVR
ncbi:MAG: hypothetical protein M3P08_04575 [Thermoproteota archaeon]|nr:hypothetical protein [Thermoproteota archaeon]